VVATKKETNTILNVLNANGLLKDKISLLYTKWSAFTPVIENKNGNTVFYGP